MISIIVPVFNKGKYIQRMYESLVAQTYTNYEVILIDDSSTDDSVKKLKSIIKKDSRFRLYQNEKNQGVSSTRNKGIEKIHENSNYVCFLDADDEYLPNFLYVMRENLNANLDYEIAYCDSLKSEEGKVSLVTYHLKNNINTGSYSLQQYIANNIYPNTNSFMFKKSFLKRTALMFDESLNWGEDALFFCEAFSHANKTIYVKQALNKYYIVRENSLSTSNINLIDKDIYWLKKLNEQLDGNQFLKTKRLILNYRIPAIIIYRLLIEFDSNGPEIILNKYRQNQIYLRNISFVNNLRSIKLKFLHIILKVKIRYGFKYGG